MGYKLEYELGIHIVFLGLLRYTREVKIDIIKITSANRFSVFGVMENGVVKFKRLL